MTTCEHKALIEKISILKRQKNAIILGHYYQDSEIQEISDFIGDSLELSKKAKTVDAKIIVFCGVKFMAEVAKILNPQAKVLVPDLKAGCSLEQSCNFVDFANFRKKHPNHYAITYINCSAEVKALSDVICTSSNAEEIIKSVPPEKPILFSPDKNLGAYLAKKTGRDMLLWDGVCMVHDRFSEIELVKMKTRNPDALIIAHPECTQSLLSYAHFVGSTSKLLDFVSKNQGGKFIVLTETGIIHQFKKINKDGVFLEAPYQEKGSIGCVSCNTCPFMRLNTMEKILLTLESEINEITLDHEVAIGAKRSLDKMLSLK